jgi:3-oxoacid CoA-transferase subunit B
MEHVNKAGESKILKSCQLPLTGKGVVERIITDRAVMDVSKNGLVLKEVAEGYSVDDVLNSTEAKLTVSDDIKLNAY